MDFAFTQQTYKSVLQHKQRLFILVAVSLSLNVLQAAERMMRTDKMVIVPALLSSSTQDQLWIKGNQVSAGYLEEWSLYLTNLLLNVSAKTMPYQSELALKHISPSMSEKLKSKLMKDLKVLLKHNAATTFFPKEMSVAEADMKVVVKGTLVTFVGKEKISSHEQAYQLKFVFNKGRFLQLDGFERITIDGKPVEEAEENLLSTLEKKEGE